MGSTRLQQAQILAALEAVPVDRIRLMKTLFLFWYRSGRPAEWPFTFKAYLYGPCAFDLYSALEDMERRGLIAQAPHSISSWARYHLTEAGRRATSSTGEVLSAAQRHRIAEIARWAARQSFRSLLDNVYREAPAYAKRSVLGQPTSPR